MERSTQLEVNIATTVKEEVSRAVVASQDGFTEEAAAACSAHLDELSPKASKILVSFSKPNPFFMLHERAKNDHEGDNFICDLGIHPHLVRSGHRQTIRPRNLLHRMAERFRPYTKFGYTLTSENSSLYGLLVFGTDGE